MNWPISYQGRIDIRINTWQSGDEFIMTLTKLTDCVLSTVLIAANSFDNIYQPIRRRVSGKLSPV
jgi:hypothetical protein